jgi:hypothetical protein
MLLDGQWAVPDAARGDRGDLVVAQPDRVRQREARAEEADLVEMRHRGGAVLLLDERHLGRALGGVDRHARLVAVRERLGAHQRFGPDGVGGVRADRRHDQRIARPFLEEGLRDAQAFVRVLQARDRVVHHRRGAETAQARLLRGVRHLVLVEVHVGEGGGAGANHLPGRELRPPGDELRRDVGRFRGPDELREPDHELDVVGHAAQERHWHVGVRVDEAGHHDPSGGVDRARRREAGAELARGPHRHDPLAFTATAASCSTRNSASIVTTVPPESSRSTAAAAAAGRGMAAASRAADDKR